MKLSPRLLILLSLFFLLGCASQAPSSPETTYPATAPTTEATTLPETEPPTEAPTEPAQERFLLTFAGDCTIGGAGNKFSDPVSFYSVVGENYSYPFENVIEYFENDDFSMVNLEGPLTESLKNANKTHFFRGPTSYVNILTQNSIEAVTLANNHTLDYFQVGYDETVETLTQAGVGFVEKDSSAIYTTESGLTIGMYAVSYDHISKDEILDAVAALDANEEVDLVIFAPHWGTEMTYTPHNMHKELAHAIIDAGADIIFGTHPHVLQPMESYNGGLIMYSMGNFVFGGSVFPGDFDTAIIQQEVIREPDGTVRLGQTSAIPCSLTSTPGHNNYQPTPYEGGSYSYRQVMRKLKFDELWQ